MKALIYDGTSIRLKDTDIPKRGPDEALVKISKAGICRTDVELAKGYMNFSGILGHEFVGVVEEAENDSLKGKRVTASINIACKKCPLCLSGRENHCPEREVIGISGRRGAFAEYISLPLSNLIPIPEGVGDEIAVFAEPLAAAMRITEQISVKPTDRVLVLGDGKMGLLTAQHLALTGCDIVVEGRYPEKLKHLEPYSIRTRLQNTMKSEEPFDIVVEATGNPEGISLALKKVKPEGVVILKSTHSSNTSIDKNAIVVNEIKVLGSRCGNMKASLRMLERGRVRVSHLISAIYPLSAGEQAFEYARGRNSLQVLLDMK